MGICEDVSPGTCDGVFIFFLVEMSILGFTLLFTYCLSPCYKIYSVVMDEANKTPEQTENENKERQKEQDYWFKKEEHVKLLKAEREKSAVVHNAVNGSPTSHVIQSHHPHGNTLLSSSFPTPQHNHQMHCTQPMYPPNMNHMQFIDPRQF